MELGTRLRQARLEAGLSQRQLCGQEITRNMLSQIENGSARPSMATLRYLAGQLGKPISYFLEEDTVASPNQALIQQAIAQPDAARRLEILSDFRDPDPLFADAHRMLTALASMDLAQEALLDGRRGYAVTLLEKAAQAGKESAFYTQDNERRRLLLCHQAESATPEKLAAQLPDNTQEILLRAAAALATGDSAKCICLLDCADSHPTAWLYLRGEAFHARQDYRQAIICYQAIEDAMPHRAYPRLENCYQAIEDYKMAYTYACKQRTL